MPKQSLLHELHRSGGAQFAEDNGWLLARHFGDPLREYQSVRSGVGLLDLCDRALLRFTGPDRASFLQGMVSNDIKRLAPGDGAQAAVLDIQGKILADTRVFCLEDSLLLDLWEPLKEKIIAHLGRYLIADDVAISDLTAEHAILSLQGPKSRTLLAVLFPDSPLPAKELAHATLPLEEMEICAARCSHTGEDGYDLLLPANHMPRVSRLIQERGRAFSLSCVGTRAQEILRLEAGIPRYGVDMDEETLLLEAGLERAVSFDKGCYLGQEVMERIHSRGHVNKRLVGLMLEAESAALPGSAIRAAGREIGKVTSSVVSPIRKCPLALGYVHRDYARSGTTVAIDIAGKSVPAAVCALPFYRAAAALESP